MPGRQSWSFPDHPPVVSQKRCVNRVHPRSDMLCPCSSYQRHEALWGFFGFPKMPKRPVANLLVGLHIYSARTWGEPPHATVSGERPEGRQNNVSCESDRRKYCFAILKSEKNWCVVHISLKWVELCPAGIASLGESKLFSRFL